MKKVYILYGRISASTGPSGKVAAYQKMLGIFESEEAAKKYEIVVDPLEDVDIDGLEYIIKDYQVMSDEDVKDLQSSN